MASARSGLFRRLLTFSKPAATPAAAARNPATPAPAAPFLTPYTQVPSSASLFQKLVPRLPRPPSSTPSIPDAFPRRFFHQNRPALPTEIPLSLRISAGERGGSALADQLRDLTPPRVSLDALSPPKGTGTATDRPNSSSTLQATAEDVRKVLRSSRMEAAREQLRCVGEKSSSVPYSEFVRICLAAAGPEHGARVAEELDASGAVIVLGNVVFLRPDLVARAIESVIPRSASASAATSSSRVTEEQGQLEKTSFSLSPPESSELRDLETRACLIDSRAEQGARAELRWGLALLAAQTVGFARLTFWELSWDVMEPICFYVTSIYFMAGWAFFLRTGRDPSFEGFLRTRVDARRSKIMAAEGFDSARLRELRSLAAEDMSGPLDCGCHHQNPPRHSTGDGETSMLTRCY